MSGQAGQSKKARGDFLAALTEGCSVVAAANASDIPRSTLYLWRNEDAEFAAAWDEALDQGTDKLEDAALQRALTVSDTLAIFLLKARRPHIYRERVELTGRVEVKTDVADALERFNTLLETAMARTATGTGPDSVPGIADSSGEGRPRLAVAGLAGKT